MHALRPAALAFSLAILVAAPQADAAKKRKPAAAPPKAAPAPAACGDFYAFANADWLKAHPVPGQGGVSALGELAERAQQQQRDLLDDAMTSPKNGVQKLLGDFWASGLDEAAVERDGAAPIAPLLARIDAIKKPQDVAPAIAALHQVGIPVAFHFTADIDLNKLDTYLGYFAQGGLGLPDATFYTRGDAEARSLLGRYNGYVQKILALSGTPQAKLASEAQLVIDLETRIARVSKSQEALRSLRASYNPVPTKDFAKKYRNLQLAAFLKAQGVTAEQVSMADPALFAQIDKLVGSLKPAQWQAYLRFQVGNAMAPYLSKSWREVEHDFRGRLLRGEDEAPERWRLTLDAINASAGAMLAQEYVARHLPDATRERADTVARAVKEAMGTAIDRNTWMDAQARTEARAKLDRVKIEIGAPRSELDFATQPMGRGSFGGNILIASTWHHREEMRRIGRGNADRRWDVLPQYPALTYDLAHNRLYATAALLQAPVLDMKQPSAAHFGGFGAMVGHELSSVVDAKGRRIDAAGALRDWWSPETAAGWDARTAPLSAFYSRFAYPGNNAPKIDGARTRDSNAADLSGLELAWAAYAKVEPDAKPVDQQHFFRGWARLWSQQLSPTATANHAAASLHPPGVWRTNAPLMQLPAFGAAFGCKAGNAMLLPDADRLSIWR
ncbi:MAG: M13-type metalloendopeptidase [Pseudomonadota bacterium]